MGVVESVHDREPTAPAGQTAVAPAGQNAAENAAENADKNPVRPVDVRPRIAVDLLLLIRPGHCAKNVLVVPLAFVDPSLWSWGSLTRMTWSVVAFVLASALVYLGNDIADRRRDRHHPAKRYRPLASGRVGIAPATGLAGVIAIVLGVLIIAGPDGQYWPVLAYLACNAAYSGGVKHLPLLDAGVVSAGFVLRVVQGYLAAGGAVPGWLLIAVFSGSLALVMGKRRRELIEAGTAHRPALRGYSVELANHLLQLTSMLTVTAALVHLRTEAPFAPHGQAVMLASTPFALFAVSRFLQLVLVHGAGADPVRLLVRDRTMIVAALLWGVTLVTTVAAVRH